MNTSFLDAILAIVLSVIGGLIVNFVWHQFIYSAKSKNRKENNLDVKQNIFYISSDFWRIASITLCLFTIVITLLNVDFSNTSEIQRAMFRILFVLNGLGVLIFCIWIVFFDGSEMSQEKDLVISDIIFPFVVLSIISSLVWSIISWIVFGVWCNIFEILRYLSGGSFSC